MALSIAGITTDATAILGNSDLRSLT